MHTQKNGATPAAGVPDQNDFFNVLIRMAEAMEQQNKILIETKQAICSVSMRIEDLMGCM